MTTQVTLFQLDNYGPWTTTPAPRPEMDLQSLQASIYADLAEFVGSRDGYVFQSRADNMIGVTNGVDRAEHERLLERVENRFPVTASAGIGVGETPADALAEATGALQRAGSAQDANRRSVLTGDGLEPGATGELQVAHFDIEDVTGRYTDTLHAFDATMAIEDGVATLRRYLREEYDALAFFVGGDNVIAVTPMLDEAAYEDVVDHAGETADVTFNVGVGTGSTARAAGLDAKHALETSREREARVVLEHSTATP